VIGGVPSPKLHLQIRRPGLQQIRIADWTAFELKQIPGFPDFDLELEVHERDRSITAIADFLRIHAADLRPPSLTSILLTQIKQRDRKAPLNEGWFDLKVIVTTETL